MKNYTKKNGFIGLVLAFSVAQTFAVSAPVYHGIYVGAEGGANTISGNSSQISGFQLTAGGTNVADIRLTPNSSVNQQTGIGGVLAGYDFLFASRFLLGLEVRGNFFDGRTTNQSRLTGISGGTTSPIMLTTTTQTQIKQDIDLLVKPGLLLRDGGSVLYFLGGAMTNELKTTNHANYLQILDAGGIPITLAGNSSFSTKEWQWGSLFGIGGQQDLAHGFTLRLEYNHLNYKRAPSSTNNTAVTTTPDTGGLFAANLPTSSSTHLRSDRVLLGLTYHFS